MNEFSIVRSYIRCPSSIVVQMRFACILLFEESDDEEIRCSNHRCGSYLLTCPIPTNVSTQPEDDIRLLARSS